MVARVDNGNVAAVHPGQAHGFKGEDILIHGERARERFVERLTPAAARR